jgi:hypothetical protein
MQLFFATRISISVYRRAIRVDEDCMKTGITADYRVQELLRALNEGLLKADFVRLKLLEWAGDQVDLIHYSDGEYDIFEH